MAILNKIYSVTLALLLAAGTVFTAVAQEEPNPDMVYTVVEQLPVYPGGDKALVQFIGSNVKYPSDAVQAGIEGRVFVSFVVDKQGKLKDAKVVKGIGGGCDQEAVRVVNMLSGWKPAKQNGKEVNYNYIIPIKFKLTDPEPDQQNEPVEKKDAMPQKSSSDKKKNR
ncbi:MAG: energy transducer TonB [Chitinophagaceae bacterium]|nr:MAG: energy transducer TonB [Chitinophagaceae bacterium]